MIKIFILSTVFNLFLMLWTVLISTSMGVVCLFNNKMIYKLAKIWAKYTIKAAEFFCGIKWNVTGLENITEGEPFIAASKHQSAWETIFFLYYFDWITYVLKKELTQIPFYGWFLSSMGMIPIDRKGGIKALKTVLVGVKNALTSGRSVVIFPEGTRVQPFKSVQYHSGIVAIYNHFKDVAIIPVALNSGLFWPRNSWNKYPGIVKVQFLPPVSKDLEKKEFLSDLQGKIDRHSDELCKYK